RRLGDGDHVRELRADGRAAAVRRILPRRRAGRAADDAARSGGVRGADRGGGGGGAVVSGCFVRAVSGVACGGIADTSAGSGVSSAGAGLRRATGAYEIPATARRKRRGEMDRFTSP